MSRHGYSDDGDCDDYWQHIRWRGAVASAIAGKRGQAALRELLRGLDSMPEKRLIRGDLQRPPSDADTWEGGVCALGLLGLLRGIDMSELDTENHDELGQVFNLAPVLVAEIMYTNDDYMERRGMSPEARFGVVREWVASQIVLTPEDLLPIPESMLDAETGLFVLTFDEGTEYPVIVKVRSVLPQYGRIVVERGTFIHQSAAVDKQLVFGNGLPLVPTPAPRESAP